MKKHLVILMSFFSSVTLFSQVGINTENPQGVFNVDGGRNNTNIGIPSADQQKDDFVILTDGSVGIGTTLPTAKLEIKTVKPATDDGINADGAIYFPTVATTPVVGPYNALGINHSTGALGTITPGAPAVFSMTSDMVHPTSFDTNFLLASGHNIQYNTLGITITEDTTNGDYLTLPAAGNYRIDVSGAMQIPIKGGTAWSGVTGAQPQGANVKMTKQPSTGGTITTIDNIRATLNVTNNSYPFYVTKVLTVTEATRVRLAAVTGGSVGVTLVKGGAGSTFAYQIIVTKL